MSYSEVKLKDIFIGCSDGESEAKKSIFLDLFYKDNKYEEIINNPMKFIISGQKGAGKTILAKYIEKTCTSINSTSKIVNLGEINLQKLIELGYKEYEECELSCFFRWFILTEFSKMLINSKCSNINDTNKSLLEKVLFQTKYKRTINKLHNFFEIRYPKGNYSYTTYTQGESNKSCVDLTEKFNDFFSFKNSVEYSTNLSRNYAKKPYYQVLDEVEELILNCLKYNKIMLIFDNLDDLGVNFYENNTHIKMLIKLLEELKNFNNKLFEKNLDGNRCIILVRSDILSILNMYSSNLNKLITDSEVNLYWIDKDYPRPENHILMDMLLTKIKNSTPKLQSWDKKAIYDKFFPDDIDGKSVINYLLDYSFGKPRDVIRYLNIIKDNNPNATCFTREMFRTCRTTYSKWFLEELKNELSIHKNPDYVKDMLKLLNDFSYRTFEFKDIKDYFNSNKNHYPNISDIKDCIETLYKFGVLGNSWQPPGTKSSRRLKFSWGYETDGNPSPDFQKKFTLHYGLRKAFSL